MFDLKNQWIGLLALAVVAVLVVLPALKDGDGLVGTRDATYISNPHVFEDTVTLESTLTHLEKSEAVTANDTVTVSQSATTFYVGGTGSTSTLPAVATATGTVLRYVVASAIATNDYVIDSAEGDNIEGSLIVAGAVVDCDAEDQINFIVDGENLGDFVELRSDGQKWFVTQSNALTSAKLTCTDPT